jgi:dihydrofolate synthase/folylpolyglutamate synthase
MKTPQTASLDGLATLNDWINYVQGLHIKEIDLGLERMRKVATRLGLLPYKGFSNSQGNQVKVITIAGTNGKGSTAAYIEQGCLSHGLNVGVYSSPHFEHFNERVRINGELVNDQVFIRALKQAEQARNAVPLSFFEMTTLAAFCVFQQADLDVLVLEIGLGGRLDAVNIIDADIAIVTSIGLDHENYLGSDLNQIAFEKISIGCANKPMVIGEPKCYPAFSECEQLIGFDSYRIHRDFQLEINDGGRYELSFTLMENQQPLKMLTWTLAAEPKLPRENLATAVQALMLLKSDWDQDRLQQALLAAELTGRFQQVSVPMPMILDVAHNSASAKLLNQRLQQGIQQAQWQSPITAVLGVLRDKDALSIVKQMSAVDRWCLVTLAGNRGQTAEQLAQLTALSDTSSLVGEFHSVADALLYLQDLTKEPKAGTQVNQSKGTVVVMGSFVTVTEALQWVRETTASG